MSHLTQYGGNLDKDGKITTKVPLSLNVHVCFETDSAAVNMEWGVLFPVLHCWTRFRPSDYPNRLIERNARRSYCSTCPSGA